MVRMKSYDLNTGDVWYSTSGISIEHFLQVTPGTTPPSTNTQFGAGKDELKR